MRTIKLSAEYFNCALWDLDEDSPGYGAPIDPPNWPVSDDLRGALLRWSEAWDATFDQSDPSSELKFATPEDEAWFWAEGRRLTDRLRAELGSTYRIKSRY